MVILEKNSLLKAECYTRLLTGKQAICQFKNKLLLVLLKKHISLYQLLHSIFLKVLQRARKTWISPTTEVLPKCNTQQKCNTQPKRNTQPKCNTQQIVIDTSGIAFDTYGKETVSLFLFFVNSLMIIGYTFVVILLAYWLGISQLITMLLSAGYHIKTSVSKSKMQGCGK